MRRFVLTDEHGSLHTTRALRWNDTHTHLTIVEGNGEEEECCASSVVLWGRISSLVGVWLRDGFCETPVLTLSKHPLQPTPPTPTPLCEETHLERIVWWDRGRSTKRAQQRFMRQQRSGSLWVERDGETRTFHSNGALHAVWTVQRSQPHTTLGAWDPNGTPLDCGSLSNGSGVLRTYYPNSALLRFEGAFEHGQPHGTHRRYSPQGALQSIQKYAHGSPVDVWVTCSEQGHTHTVTHYTRAHIETWTFDPASHTLASTWRTTPPPHKTPLEYTAYTATHRTALASWDQNTTGTLTTFHHTGTPTSQGPCIAHNTRVYRQGLFEEYTLSGKTKRHIQYDLDIPYTKPRKELSRLLRILSKPPKPKPKTRSLSSHLRTHAQKLIQEAHTLVRGHTPTLFDLIQHALQHKRISLSKELAFALACASNDQTLPQALDLWLSFNSAIQPDLDHLTETLTAQPWPDAKLCALTLLATQHLHPDTLQHPRYTPLFQRALRSFSDAYTTRKPLLQRLRNLLSTALDDTTRASFLLTQNGPLWGFLLTSRHPSVLRAAVDDLLTLPPNAFTRAPHRLDTLRETCAAWGPLITPLLLQALSQNPTATATQHLLHALHACPSPQTPSVILPLTLQPDPDTRSATAHILAQTPEPTKHAVLQAPHDLQDAALLALVQTPITHTLHALLQDLHTTLDRPDLDSLLLPALHAHTTDSIHLHTLRRNTQLCERDAFFERLHNTDREHHHLFTQRALSTSPSLFTLFIDELLQHLHNPTTTPQPQHILPHYAHAFRAHSNVPGILSLAVQLLCALHPKHPTRPQPFLDTFSSIFPHDPLAFALTHHLQHHTQHPPHPHIASWLATHAPHIAHPLLLPLIDSPSAPTRRAVQHALIATPSLSTNNALYHHLQNSKAPTRRAAASVLLETPHPNHIPHLQNALQRETHPTRTTLLQRALHASQAMCEEK